MAFGLRGERACRIQGALREGLAVLLVFVEFVLLLIVYKNANVVTS